ncbi:hypothetical protein, partial [Escherichia coli]
YNNISYVLLFIHREFKSEFSNIIKIFAEDSRRDKLVEVLLSTIQGVFDESKKEILRSNIGRLLAEMG